MCFKPSLRHIVSKASNHLDIECVEALSEALSEWGDETGAIVVVSHDRAFCSKIEFTHVATVEDGRFTMEQRDTRESDWVIDNMKEVCDEESSAPNDTNGQEIDPKLRKQAYNAPKRIAKLEQLIEEAENRMAELDNEMLENGSDVGLLVDLNKEKESLETKVEEYMEEWEQLEEVLAIVA